MSSKCRSNAQSMKQEKEKAEMHGRRIVKSEKATAIRSASIRERKMALQQDVDKLKKKLRHEESIHRALERAFTRPLGALPRLPSYLPPNTLELLAEIAVLEEEVVRLEERVLQFRKELYQEAVHISSSPKIRDDTAYFSEPDPRREKENQTSTNSTKNKKQWPNLKAQTVRNLATRTPFECRPSGRHSDPQRSQMEICVKTDYQSSEEWKSISQDDLSPVDNNPNRISESTLKCLMNIFLRMSSNKSRSNAGTLPPQDILSYSGTIPSTEFKDPYRICSKFGRRELGPYKHLSCIESPIMNPNQMMKPVFPVQKLKVLLKKLESAELKGLTNQEKVAFWINIYNACMMNAFFEYGVPEIPEMVVTLSDGIEYPVSQAKLNVGGHILNATTVEHFILRLPYHSKHILLKCQKYEEVTKSNLFGSELSEPLVRVYTASHVENQLEAAKREYLQAAVGISTSSKLIARPELLDWYFVDFAKDMESLLDWICLQLPSELGKEAMKCLERKHDDPLQQPLRIMPYEFSLRYLLHTSSSAIF